MPWQIVHLDITCDGCEVEPIVGERWAARDSSTCMGQALCCFPPCLLGLTKLDEASCLQCNTCMAQASLPASGCQHGGAHRGKPTQSSISSDCPGAQDTVLTRQVLRT